MKALVWRLTYRGDDGRDGFRARAGHGYYRVSPLIGSRARYYQANHHVGGRQRIVSPRSLAAMEAVTTAGEGKAFAQADYDAGDVDARTRQEPQALTPRLSL
jgi:hypothetical protein